MMMMVEVARLIASLRLMLDDKDEAKGRRSPPATATFKVQNPQPRSCTPPATLATSCSWVLRSTYPMGAVRATALRLRLAQMSVRKTKALRACDAAAGCGSSLHLFALRIALWLRFTLYVVAPAIYTHSFRFIQTCLGIIFYRSGTLHIGDWYTLDITQTHVVVASPHLRAHTSTHHSLTAPPPPVEHQAARRHST